MSVIVTGIDMPKSCDVCSYMETNDDLMSSDYRYMYCGQPYMGDYVTDYVACRHPDCPLKSVDGLVERINKLAYSETEYGIEEFDASKIVRLDDLIEVIKEYCGMEDAE